MVTSNKIYNSKTGRYIANTAANRKRLKAGKASRRQRSRAKPTKGDCKCYYKGSEPSPKGRGYCAHCGKLGTQKLGTDGMKWKIKKRTNRSLYWAKMK